MRLEIFQFLVPLAFLAIWALTALLNRDAQQLPPRPGGSGLPDGLPRGGGMAGRVAPSGAARYVGAVDRSSRPVELMPGSRWSSPGGADRERPDAERKPRAEEGILALESEARGAFSGSGSGTLPSRGGRAPSSRRGSRGRSVSQAGAAKSAEPGKPRALSALVNQALNDQKARHLEIAPLAVPLVPIDVPLAQSISSSVTNLAPRSQPTPSVTGKEIRARLKTPSSLREVAILSEILQPPVSLRGPRRAR
jgi:hypothetical protein